MTNPRQVAGFFLCRIWNREWTVIANTEKLLIRKFLRMKLQTHIAACRGAEEKKVSFLVLSECGSFVLSWRAVRLLHSYCPIVLIPTLNWRSSCAAALVFGVVYGFLVNFNTIFCRATTTRLTVIGISFSICSSTFPSYVSTQQSNKTHTGVECINSFVRVSSLRIGFIDNYPKYATLHFLPCLAVSAAACRFTSASVPSQQKRVNCSVCI